MDPKEIVAKLKTIDGEIQALITAIEVVPPPPPPPVGPVLYVDQSYPQASDTNPGTEVLPLKTLQAAHDKALPGTTVIIKAGTYTESDRGVQTLYITKSGTAAQPLTFRAFKKLDGTVDQVVIDGRGSVWYGIRIAKASYVTLENITVIRNENSGISIGRGFWDGTDIINAPADNITITNCVVHDNALNIPSNNGQNGGFEVVGPSHDIFFARCESHHNNGRGFFLGSSHETNQLILPYGIALSSCYAHHNGLNFANGAAGANNADGITTAGARMVSLFSCVSDSNVADQITEEGPWADNNTWALCVAMNGNPNANPNGDGNGFKVGNINPAQLGTYVGAKNHIVKNCFAINNANRGFEDTEGALESQYVKNHAIGNKSWGFLTEGKNAYLKDNVAYGNGVTNKYDGIFGDAVLCSATITYSDFNYWADLSAYPRFQSNHETSKPRLGCPSAIIELNSRAGVIAAGPVTVDTNLWVGNPALRVPNPNFAVVTGVVTP